ncbi:STAS domain-containing protein [Azoarcus indigens]|uniref:Anti-anti-sigma factor n=1 Tax=Azoarcus indigens TaxID=29545 RepID=A0A4R6DDU2_9RHOO|nr:STAS domain-containing protein [Azoarcus indigens]TDN42354.1 anti-anti-sigma factor [Azoarcus indigens]
MSADTTANAPADEAPAADLPDAEGRMRIVLEGDVDIYAADALWRRLIAGLRAATVLELDLSAVSLIDTTGLQILAQLQRTAAREGRSLRLSAHSPAAAEAIEFLGLAPLFGDPLPIQTPWA